MIFAHSSGAPHRNHATFYGDLRNKGGELITFQNFTEEQARQYIETFATESAIDAIDDFKVMTNFNPMLLNVAMTVPKGYGFQDRQVVAVRTAVTDYVASTLAVPQQIADLNLFNYKLGRTNEFLYYAKTNHNLLKSEYQSFLESWVYQEGHCYITSFGTDNFNIALNFPRSDEMISQQIARVVRMKSPLDFHCNDATLLGCQLEFEFTTACQQSPKFAITHGGRTSTFTISACLNIENMSEALNMGVLYKLYASHPAIDFVGQFETDNSVYLLMIQVSLSTYVNHKSKVCHLTHTYQNYKEFVKMTVLQYYKSIANTNAIVLFVYVSPQEMDVPSSLVRQISDRSLDITPGFIVNSGSCPLSQVINKFKLEQTF